MLNMSEKRCRCKTISNTFMACSADLYHSAVTVYKEIFMLPVICLYYVLLCIVTVLSRQMQSRTFHQLSNLEYVAYQGND